MKYLFPLVALLIAACSSEPKKEIEADPPVESEAIKIDSSFYYDSINAPYKDSIERYFSHRMASRQFNGAYIFAQNGYIIAENYHGLKDFSSKDSIRSNTVFQLASGSKPFTAIGILKLVQEDLLNLEDSIHHLIPELPYKGITVRMLLTHRGGLGNYIYFTEYLMKDSVGVLYNQSILDILQDTVPSIYFPPDQKHEYSNTGYALLALIVEKVSGLKFQEWMQENIFSPNEMTHSFVIDKRKKLPQHAAIGYVGQKHLNPGNDYLNGVVGDKGLYSCPQDVLNFDQALYNGFIADSLIELSMKAHNPINYKNESYGLGWRLIHPDTPEKIVYHTGWWQGFRTHFIRYPKERKTVIVMDNVKTGPGMGVKELLGLITADY